MEGNFTTSNESDKPELENLAEQFASKGQEGRDLTVSCDVDETNSVPGLDD